MASTYSDDVQFAGLVEAATAAADAHQRDLGKRKRGDSSSYLPAPTDISFPDSPHSSSLTSSAAVLFREPSEKSKKYSRPPLGKVFTSLELAPESFLRLQDAAKNYMLDEQHPERRDVVGHKKHGSNNDEAKLKLWQCVDEFLRADNVGDKFFGHTAGLDIPDAPQRSFFWPDDHNRIIKLLMPLLRKMVTNERQRLYAAATRKQEPRGPDKIANATHTSHANGTPTEEPVIPEIDPSLQASHVLEATNGTHVNTASSNMIVLHVNIMTDENGLAKRVIPEIDIAASSAPTLSALLEQLQKHVDYSRHNVKVKALLPEGLVEMQDDSEWIMSHVKAGSYEWMNNELKVLVEI